MRTTGLRPTSRSGNSLGKKARISLSFLHRSGKTRINSRAGRRGRWRNDRVTSSLDLRALWADMAKRTQKRTEIAHAGDDLSAALKIPPGTELNAQFSATVLYGERNRSKVITARITSKIAVCVVDIESSSAFAFTARFLESGIHGGL